MDRSPKHYYAPSPQGPAGISGFSQRKKVQEPWTPFPFGTLDVLTLEPRPVLKRRRRRSKPMAAGNETARATGVSMAVAAAPWASQCVAMRGRA